MGGTETEGYCGDLFPFRCHDGECRVSRQAETVLESVGDGEKRDKH